jgi:hypothetical protein
MPGSDYRENNHSYFFEVSMTWFVISHTSQLDSVVKSHARHATEAQTDKVCVGRSYCNKLITEMTFDVAPVERILFFFQNRFDLASIRLHVSITLGR